jgi:hypothetical protein
MIGNPGEKGKRKNGAGKKGEGGRGKGENDQCPNPND